MSELRSGLELATDEELKQLTQIMFCRRFNPLDYWQTPEPIEIQSQEREIWLDELEKRFRFLAANGLTVLKRKTQEVTYRQTLIQVCCYLKIPYSSQMTTVEIEAEVFLNLVDRTWKRLSSTERQSLTIKVQNSLAQSNFSEPLPVSLQHDPINLLLRGGSAVAFSSVLKPLLLQHLARQFAIHFASYQVAKGAIVKGSITAATQWQNQMALQTAKRGMAITAARHTAVRSVFAIMGPLLWGCFFADLGWRAISINYGRIIPTIFTVAQIRLTRCECWEAV